MSNEVQERWRELVGVKGKPGPNELMEFSGSGGDRERGKFRPSEYPRLYTTAVVNDDGTPIAAITNGILVTILENVALLPELLAEYRDSNNLLRRLLAEAEKVQDGQLQ